MLGPAGCHAHAGSQQQSQHEEQHEECAAASQLQYATATLEPFASHHQQQQQQQNHQYQHQLNHYASHYPTFVDHQQAQLIEQDHFGGSQLVEAANQSFGAEYLELDAPSSVSAEQSRSLSYAHLSNNLNEQQQQQQHNNNNNNLQQQQQHYASVQQSADYGGSFSLVDELGVSGEFPGSGAQLSNEQLLVQQLDSGHASSNASCLLEHSSASSLIELQQQQQQPAGTRDSVLSRGPLTQENCTFAHSSASLYNCAALINQPVGRRLSIGGASLSASQANCGAPQKRPHQEHQEPFKVCEWEGCYNTFISMAEFVRHLEERHVNQNPKEKNRYFCLWARCKRNELEFNARYKLLIHMRVHSGEKPYPCSSANCAKSFSRLENLKIHVRSHTGEKPYKCNFNNCAKSFTNSSDRIKHHKTHRDPKPYSCSHHNCAKRYTDPSSLRKHLRAHKRQQPADLAPVTADFNALALHQSNSQQQQQQQQQQLQLQTPQAGLLGTQPEACFAAPSHSSSAGAPLAPEQWPGAWRHESGFLRDQQQQQHNQLSRSWCAGGLQEPGHAPWHAGAACPVEASEAQRRRVRWEGHLSGGVAQGGGQRVEAEEGALMRSLPASNSLEAGWRAANNELEQPRPNQPQEPT